MNTKKVKLFAIDTVAIIVAILVYAMPFYFIFTNAVKDRKSAGLMQLTLPDSWHFENFKEVFMANNYAVPRGFFNSTVITVGSILILCMVCAMAGYILQRRTGRLMTFINFIVLAGLMVPPAILPTIYVLKAIGVYKTLFGMILVEVALNTPFAIMLYRGYMLSIPKELEEAAFVDGCGKWKMFIKVIFPMLMPVTATIAVLTGVTIFNDFTNPLYFLPGAKNTTVQLTLYTFLGKYGSQWQLLFADVVIITIPPMIMFIALNKKIISGITAGALKG